MSDNKENRNNRFVIPKSEIKQEDNSNVKASKIIAEKIEQGKTEDWTAEKLVTEIEKAITKVFNFDDVADKMTNRLLANFQNMNKETSETKEPEAKVSDIPQSIELKEPEKQVNKKSGIFGLKT